MLPQKYHYFTYSISISLLVFEHDKLTFLGFFGHLALYLLLNIDIEPPMINGFKSTMTKWPAQKTNT